MNSNNFIRVQKNYFFEFGKIIEFFRVLVAALTRTVACALRSKKRVAKSAVDRSDNFTVASDVVQK